MTDPLDIYNTTGSEITIQGTVVPANGFVSVSSANAVAWSKDPFLMANIFASKIGVSVYGTDLGTSYNGAAMAWMNQIAEGLIVY